jgi:hypothetical protein
LTDICQGWHDANVEYSIYISLENGQPLNNGDQLNEFGKAYQEFIHSH